jgi:hypothetical protein
MLLLLVGAGATASAFGRPRLVWRRWERWPDDLILDGPILDEWDEEWLLFT